MPKRNALRWGACAAALAGAALGLSTVCSRALAQAPIRVQINEVIVPVTVTDDKGRFVSDLTQQDFRIFDEGKEQKIEYFSHDSHQPVVIGFLL
ncbi:MAG TPA: hypothetical protein VG345_00425, partial [Bryobacteraceae bacterium]|nr:hypothetical protein [Bryobacteraceae bacterium]